MTTKYKQTNEFEWMDELNSRDDEHNRMETN